MGAPKVTSTEIIEMQRLYAELGNYAAVARRIHRSDSTVAKYIKMNGIPTNIKVVVHNTRNTK